MRKRLWTPAAIFLAGILAALGLNGFHSLSASGGQHLADDWFYVSVVYILVGTTRFMGWYSGGKSFFNLYLTRSDDRLRELRDRDSKFAGALQNGLFWLVCGMVYFTVSFCLD
jgi:hypothetical protein